MDRVAAHPRLAAGVLTLLLFTFLLLTGYPLLNSGDDAFLMYTMGGGFGEAPTELLHYNHIWHPLLGWLGKTIFTLLPGLNGYTFLLVAFHFIATSTVATIALKQLGVKAGTCMVLIFFMFFESRQLTSLTVTGSSFMLALAGGLSVIHSLREKKTGLLHLAIPFTFLLLAGLLRLQVALLVMVLTGAVAITVLQPKQWIRTGLLFAFVAALLWLANQQHEAYYKKTIPGWEQQEKFRQAVFYAYNRPLREKIPAGVFRNEQEQALFFAGYFYDNSRFTIARVDSIAHAITGTRSFARAADRKGFYWFFIELRVYLLLFVALFLLVRGNAVRQLLLRWAVAVLAYVAIHVYLFIFLKITVPLHFGLLAFLWVAFLVQTSKDCFSETYRSIQRLAGLTLLIAAIAWMGIRLYKEREVNRTHAQQFYCGMQLLEANKDKIFVVTDDAFPISYFPVFATPVNYPAVNLVYKDRLLNGTYVQTLRRLGLTVADLVVPDNKAIILTGQPLEVLKQLRSGTYFSEALPGSNCVELHQLRQAP